MKHVELCDLKRSFIVCSKCGMTAKKLFYNTRINVYKQQKSTPIGYCERCKRYEIPQEINN